jgi:RNA polymerase sigma-70 factor (ECF subfamily)
VADPGRSDVFAAAYRSVQREEVRGALAKLPEEQRLIIELAYFAGRTQQEIATQVGVPLGTVKSRTRLALARLKSAFDPEMAGSA